MDGFSYNGVHSSAFNCFYVPPAAGRGGDMEDYDIVDQQVDGRDGGYYVGDRVEARDFTLECYFEDISLNMRERLLNWLHRKTSGE